MRLGIKVFGGSGARVSNLRLSANAGKLWVAGLLASMLETLTVARHGVFTNPVKSCIFRRLRRRLARVIHPERSELASA